MTSPPAGDQADQETVLDGFTSQSFTHERTTRDVYWIGEGPGILFMHEVPGITPACARFARALADAGFTVAVPDLLGTPGRPQSHAYMARSMASLCVAREFQAFALKADRPIISWLRALGRQVHDRCGGQGIGAVGMCMTGGFALGLAVDDHLLAPVLSQPSLPVAITPLHARDIGITDAQADVVRRRCDAEGLSILGLRFKGDPLVPAARFRALAERFGDAFEAIELDAREWKSARAAIPANERGYALGPQPHSVLGGDYMDAPPTRAALDRTIQFFSERLNG